ncbi:MogA/MoaB family molybdenum cofactor biosynthesis protein [soil metagenome]
MTSIRAAVVTVSDTRSVENDISGNELVKLLTAAGIEISVRRSTTDDFPAIRDLLVALSEREDIDLILTTGGTGFAPRDNTPEATRTVIEREAPGLAEAIRRETAGSTPLAMLSRGVCGIRGSTLIINLPGSPKAVSECFGVVRNVLPHAVALIRGDKPH